MKISKKMAQVMTVLTVVLGILFATSMVFAAGYEIPSAKATNADTAITNIGGMVLSIAPVSYTHLLSTEYKSNSKICGKRPRNT